MNTYYLHDGKTDSGPFDIDELKEKKITKTTSVWCEGMEDWQNAGDVAELKKLFFATPPPLKRIATPSVASKKGYFFEVKKITRTNKKTVFIGIGILVLSIGTVIFNTILESRTLKLEEQNNKTEYNNHQYKIQEKEIQDQKQFIAEQEKLEAERIGKERKLTISNRLLEIKNLLTVANSNIDNSNNDLNTVRGFKFLRTNNEREDDINSVENNIAFWHNEIEQLENERSMLYLELEKIH
jgi:cytochrome c biogenesis factor